jgi:hypothetical protein
MEMDYFQIINTVGTIVSTAIAGYAVWRTRRNEEAQVENAHTIEQVKSELATKQHESTVAFNSQFVLYQELWRAAHQLRQVVAHADPAVRSDKLAPDDLLELNKQFAEEIGLFHDLVESNKPFIEPDVYQSLQNFYAIASAEKHRAFMHREFQGMEAMSRRAEGMMSLLEASEEVSHAIRKRLIAHQS